MANGTRSRSIAMRWRPLQEKEKRRNKRGREKKSVFIYMRIILPYGKSCRVSYIFVRSTVGSINLEITWATYLRLIKHIILVYFFLFGGRNRATPNRKYHGKLVD